MQKLPKIILIPAVVICVLGNFQAPVFEPEKSIRAEKNLPEILTIQENSLISFSPLPEPKVIDRIRIVVTAYSSTVSQTDDDPFTTAAGTKVRDGIIANNLLPFGTKVRLPELYGDKIFTVEDRMNPKKGYYHFDIWFSSYLEAKDFGAKNTYAEILEN